MPISWQSLNEIRDCVPIASLGVNLDQPINNLPIIGENPQSTERFALKGWFKIGLHQYIHCQRDVFQGSAWAASDGAFAYILTNDSYFDDGKKSPPPKELLPNQRDFDLKAVAAYGRAYRGFCDYDSIEFARLVAFDRWNFYYRHALAGANEAPICIKIKPQFKDFDFR